jgi:hypothetical protein
VRALDIFLAKTAHPSAEAMLYAGQREITRIRKRTLQGTDVDGSPFAPYSKSYAKYRAKRGRNVSPVDLLFHGIMQTSLTVEVRGESAFAIVEKDPKAAVYGRAHNEGNSRLPKRRWFDTNTAELGEMTKDLLAFDTDAFTQSIG